MTACFSCECTSTKTVLIKHNAEERDARTDDKIREEDSSSIYVSIKRFVKVFPLEHIPIPINHHPSLPHQATILSTILRPLLIIPINPPFLYPNRIPLPISPSPSPFPFPPFPISLLPPPLYQTPKPRTPPKHKQPSPNLPD